MKKQYLLIVTILLLIIGCANTVTSMKKEQPKAVDPVCAYFFDMGCIHVVVNEDTPRSDYKGITYYFCSDECKNDFDSNPAKYLKGVISSSPAEEVEDPVCGRKINVKEADTVCSCLYQGKMHYFCSDRCRTQYMENPDRFTRKK